MTETRDFDSQESDEEFSTNKPPNKFNTETKAKLAVKISKENVKKKMNKKEEDEEAWNITQTKTQKRNAKTEPSQSDYASKFRGKRGRGRGDTRGRGDNTRGRGNNLNRRGDLTRGRAENRGRARENRNLRGRGSDNNENKHESYVKEYELNEEEAEFEREYDELSRGIEAERRSQQSQVEQHNLTQNEEYELDWEYNSSNINRNRNEDNYRSFGRGNYRGRGTGYRGRGRGRGNFNYRRNNYNEGNTQYSNQSSGRNEFEGESSNYENIEETNERRPSYRKQELPTKSENYEKLVYKKKEEELEEREDKPTIEESIKEKEEEKAENVIFIKEDNSEEERKKMMENSEAERKTSIENEIEALIPIRKTNSAKKSFKSSDLFESSHPENEGEDSNDLNSNVVSGAAGSSSNNMRVRGRGIGRTRIRGWGRGRSRGRGRAESYNYNNYQYYPQNPAHKQYRKVQETSTIDNNDDESLQTKEQIDETEFKEVSVKHKNQKVNSDKIQNKGVDNEEHEENDKDKKVEFEKYDKNYGANDKYDEEDEENNQEHLQQQLDHQKEEQFIPQDNFTTKLQHKVQYKRKQVTIEEDQNYVKKDVELIVEELIRSTAQNMETKQSQPVKTAEAIEFQLKRDLKFIPRKSDNFQKEINIQNQNLNVVTLEKEEGTLNLERKVKEMENDKDLKHTRQETETGEQINEEKEEKTQEESNKEEKEEENAIGTEALRSSSTTGESDMGGLGKNIKATHAKSIPSNPPSASNLNNQNIHNMGLYSRDINSQVHSIQPPHNIKSHKEELPIHPPFSDLDHYLPPNYMAPPPQQIPQFYPQYPQPIQYPETPYEFPYGQTSTTNPNYMMPPPPSANYLQQPPPQAQRKGQKNQPNQRLPKNDDMFPMNQYYVNPYFIMMLTSQVYNTQYDERAHQAGVGGNLYGEGPLVGDNKQLGSPQFSNIDPLLKNSDMASPPYSQSSLLQNNPSLKKNAKNTEPSRSSLGSEQEKHQLPSQSSHSHSLHHQQQQQQQIQGDNTVGAHYGGSPSPGFRYNTGGNSLPSMRAVNPGAVSAPLNMPPMNMNMNMPMPSMEQNLYPQQQFIPPPGYYHPINNMNPLNTPMNTMNPMNMSTMPNMTMLPPHDQNYYNPNLPLLHPNNYTSSGP